MDRPEGDIWIFGYGSLMWRPNFPYTEAAPALLRGYHRSLCIYSTEYRGTWERPGLVLGLDRGGSCVGVAFRVEGEKQKAVMAYLRERELVSSAYLEKRLELSLTDGRHVEAVAYVIDPHHVQYCHLALEEQARIIARAHGGRGPNTEYLYNTAAHLDEIGVPDADLHWLVREVKAL